MGPLTPSLIFPVTLTLAVAFVLLSVAARRLRSEKARLARRLQPLIDVDAEAQSVRDEIQKLLKVRDQLTNEYQQGRSILDRLRKEVAGLEENLEDISYGLYRPHFTYAASAEYKDAIEAVRSDEKTMVRGGEAASCPVKWNVGGSEREGERMMKQYQKLLLRAFNGEADAAIANVSWSNYRIMEERLRKAQEALNKLGTVMQVTLTDRYRDLKMRELRLVFEHEEKKQQEREEQRRVRALMREEEKVQRERAKAQEEAAEEEVRYGNALEKVQQEVAAAVGAERDELMQRVTQLETQLAEAHAKKERAQAQAELTKSGHVYIISNIGSFGEGILKIGMTRRLEPEERIQELGDASVPFPFDVHALIYAKDAPDLETALHNHFWERRINLSNDRKEFFRVSVEDIETFANGRGLKVEFRRMAEAKEYRQTQAALKTPQAPAEVSAAALSGETEYPNELFRG
jgi:chromosome segregation ATPase